MAYLEERREREQKRDHDVSVVVFIIKMPRGVKLADGTAA